MKCKSCNHTWYNNFLPRCPKCQNLDGYDDERFNMETKQENAITLPDSLKDWYNKVSKYKDKKVNE